MGLILTPVLVRHLLGPPGLSGLMTSTSWTQNLPTVLLEAVNLCPAAHPTHPACSLPTPFYVQSMILQQL